MGPGQPADGYVTLRDLADVHAGVAPGGFAQARAAWEQAHGSISQEFFGNRLPVAAVLTADGRLHLEYSAGRVSSIEPLFAETLTRIEFIASQADIFLEPAYWPRTDDTLEVRNIGTRTVRVGGKPMLTPIGEDGQPLETEFVVTAELRMPPYVDLAPGQRAAAPVDWAA